MRKTALRKQLAQHTGLVHFSFDLWTSPNSLAIIGIVGHWIEHSKTNISRLLGFRRLSGPHSSKNLCVTVLTVIDDYDFRAQVEYFMLDNVRNNDTYVDALCQILFPRNPFYVSKQH
jgi:hypothetical protein